MYLSRSTPEQGTCASIKRSNNRANPSHVRRAGVAPTSQELDGLLDTIVASAFISLYGFYAHAGHSYASTSQERAVANLQDELSAVNVAAGHAIPKFLARGHPEPVFILSVGATPTAHAASDIVRVPHPLNGAIELHAGNYPMLDSQQLATNLVNVENVAQRVLASVVSYYPGRGEGDEAMCDVGGIGMSKDNGPYPGYGKVVNVLREGEDITWAPRETGWVLGRISQEHGILTRANKCAPEREQDILRLGDVVGESTCSPINGWSMF